MASMSSAAESPATMPGPHIEVLVSNLALPHFVAALGSVAMTERTVHKIGADGVELTHVNPGFNAMTRQILDPETSPETEERIRGLVHSQHASFVGERPAPNILGRLFAIRQVMPGRDESLDYMRRTQTITGTLPGVLYTRYSDRPPSTIHYSDEEAPFAPTLFQPKRDDWEEMGLTEESSAADIKQAMSERGLTGVAFDLFQALEFGNPHKLVDTLLEAGLIDEVHLSVDRTDLVGLRNWRSAVAQRTRRAGRAFARSPEDARETDEGKLLFKILQKWHEEPEKPRRVVIEKGPWDFFRRSHKLGRIVMSTRSLIQSAQTA